MPAKTALVLTGSAIALAGYIGASSDATGHAGHEARQASLAAALTASRRAWPAGPGGVTATGTGLEISSTGGPGPIALAGYSTTAKHPDPRHYARRHPEDRTRHHRAERHHARHHRARGHRARGHRAHTHRGWWHRSPWQIAGSLMPDYQWTSWQFRYLNLLWMRESGWNRFASNHSSGAYGIPQAVPGDKMASAGPNWRTSARTQIIWGMGYIKSRYGDPWNAWQHELAYGWY